MEKKTIYRASSIAAIVAFICALFMGFGVSVPAGVELQPSLSYGPVTEFVYPINAYPDLTLRFFTADSLFVLSYIMVFIGLYSVAKDKSHIYALTGLVAGTLTGLFDATENAFFIAYAASALNGVPLSEPALPLIYIVANLKWMSAFAALYAFGLVWPRDGYLGWTITGLMLLFPVVGVLGVAIPSLVPIRGLFFLLGMPLFVWDFWRRHRR